ncbi:MAG: ORF6N domain-containing protein [Fusobacterium sp.]|nr:ORF6N domain-containing protein [Fusobacterium sp.]
MEKNLIEINNTEDIQNLIYTIRGKQVMLDSDLAKLYQVKTKVFNQAVKRNIKRFPSNFMFQLTKEEVDLVRSQIVTSPKDTFFSGQDGGRRYNPYVFTEQGISMLSAVLKSDIAVEISIKIINTFVQMRKYFLTNGEIFSRLDKLEFNQMEDKAQVLKKNEEYDKKFEEIFNYIATKQEISQRIFFDGQIYDAFSLIVEIIQKASKEIILIDNYVSLDTLNILSKRKEKVKIKIYTSPKTKLNKMEISKFNKQYKNLSVAYVENFHDRFLILDKNLCYHIGASIKDLGKKSFAISKIVDKKNIEAILNRLK